MHIRQLAVRHAFEVTPRQYHDDRGAVVELFRSDALTEAVGHPLALAQANCSVSRRGALRGIHFAEVPPGQAKYVSCLSGAVLDVAVDIRVGSPTYGVWDSVVLDDRDRRAVYLPEGVGHAFLALTRDATVTYLCSSPYAPAREHGICPFDRELAIAWPQDLQPLLSAKDAQAPTLAEIAARGLLPTYEACRRRYDDLRERAATAADGP